MRTAVPAATLRAVRHRPVESAIGTIPSEAFDISGTICYYDCQPPPPPACFEPDGNLQVIHDFTEQEGGGGAVAIDNAGNVYGTTRSGGDHGLGFVYRLSPKGQDWVFTPLYSFMGGYNGGPLVRSSSDRMGLCTARQAGASRTAMAETTIVV